MTDTVCVPVEPTEAMLDAACYHGPDTPAGRFDYSDARTVWSAMLAASPQGEGSSADADTHRAADGAVAGDLTPWEMAADEICLAMVKRAEPRIREAAEFAYEQMLYGVQDYLRENAGFNLKSHLERVENYGQSARLALTEIAMRCGVSPYESPEKIQASVVAVVAGLRAAADKAATANSVGMSEANAPYRVTEGVKP